MLSYALYAIFGCLNPWTGAIFMLGPNNEYKRGPLFMAMLALYIVYSVALFIMILVRWKFIPKNYPGTVLLATPVIISLGIVAQLSMPGTRLMLPAYMICLVFAFLFFQNIQLKSSRQLMMNLSRVAETGI